MDRTHPRRQAPSPHKLLTPFTCTINPFDATYYCHMWYDLRYILGLITCCEAGNSCLRILSICTLRTVDLVRLELANLTQWLHTARQIDDWSWTPANTTHKEFRILWHCEKCTFWLSLCTASGGILPFRPIGAKHELTAGRSVEWCGLNCCHDRRRLDDDGKPSAARQLLDESGNQRDILQMCLWCVMIGVKISSDIVYQRPTGRTRPQMTHWRAIRPTRAPLK